LLSPYFYHDAFVHHALHVLDAPGTDIRRNCSVHYPYTLTAALSPPGPLEIGPELLLTTLLENHRVIRHSARE